MVRSRPLKSEKGTGRGAFSRRVLAGAGRGVRQAAAVLGRAFSRSGAAARVRPAAEPAQAPQRAQRPAQHPAEPPQLAEAAPPTRRPARRWSAGGEVQLALRFAGLLCEAFGWPFWLIGGLYTVRGWIVGLNLALLVLGLPVRVPELSGWWNLLCVPVAFGYSLVEVRLRPSRRFLRALARSHGWGVALVLVGMWLASIVTDVGSTYMAIISPGPGAWAIERWIAERPAVAGIGSVLLTFAPEIIIMSGVALLFKNGGRHGPDADTPDHD